MPAAPIRIALLSASFAITACIVVPKNPDASHRSHDPLFTRDESSAGLLNEAKTGLTILDRLVGAVDHVSGKGQSKRIKRIDAAQILAQLFSETGIGERLATDDASIFTYRAESRRGSEIMRKKGGRLYLRVSGHFAPDGTSLVDALGVETIDKDGISDHFDLFPATSGGAGRAFSMDFAATERLMKTLQKHDTRIALLGLDGNVSLAIDSGTVTFKATALSVQLDNRTIKFRDLEANGQADSERVTLSLDFKATVVEKNGDTSQTLAEMIVKTEAQPTTSISETIEKAVRDGAKIPEAKP